MLTRLFVEIFEVSARDGDEINKVIVPVIYGPLIVPNYIGYRLYQVRRGDTLSAIAQQHYGDASRFHQIVAANPTIISDPDLIFVGQVLKIPIGA
jgi:nucleoid-associated protein YgaU